MSILSCLIKSSHDAVFIAEVETGRLAYANEAACKLSGYSLDEIIGKHFTHLHPPYQAAHVMAIFKEFSSSTDHHDAQMQILRKDGKIIEVMAGSADVFEDNEIVYSAAYFKDLSMHRKLRDIAQMQSHIVRAPVANLIGLISLMEHDMSKNQTDHTETLGMMKQMVEKLDVIIREVVATTEF